MELQSLTIETVVYLSFSPFTFNPFHKPLESTVLGTEREKKIYIPFIKL
jgi:hypothetical protein